MLLLFFCLLFFCFFGFLFFWCFFWFCFCLAIAEKTSRNVNGCKAVIEPWHMCSVSGCRMQWKTALQGCPLLFRNVSKKKAWMAWYQCGKPQNSTQISPVMVGLWQLAQVGLGFFQPSRPFNFFGHAWLVSSASSVPGRARAHLGTSRAVGPWIFEPWVPSGELT